MAPLDIFGPTFVRLLESADAGSIASSWTLDRLVRYGRVAGIRERLATETVQYGLVKLYDFMGNPDEMSELDFEVLSESLVFPLSHLATATNIREVLVYGHSAFTSIRYHPRGREIIKVPLRLHDQFAVQAGLRQEGMPELLWRTAGLSEPPRRVLLRVREASRNLLGRLSPRVQTLDLDVARIFRGYSGEFGWGGFGTPPASRGPGEDPPVSSTKEFEPGRYTDLTLYEDHLFPGDDLNAAARLADDKPLVVGAPYTLEVRHRRLWRRHGRMAGGVGPTGGADQFDQRAFAH